MQSSWLFFTKSHSPSRALTTVSPTCLLYFLLNAF